MKTTWTAGARSTIQMMYPGGVDLKSGDEGHLSCPAGGFAGWAAILLIIMAMTFNMVDAEESATGHAKEGDLITYYYNVSNIGNVNLTEVEVIDDKVVPNYVKGDANGDGWLNLSETWLYKAIYKVTEADLMGDIINIANATARDPCGKPVDDQDIEVVKTAIRDAEPIQYGQFCEAQKISGTGIIDARTSMYDKKIALEYYNNMNGQGDIELDQEQAYSENADKLKRNISSVNGGNESTLNLYESTKLTYSGDQLLQGEKFLHSRALYGGIGAQVREAFSVQEIEREEVSFFAQTMPYQPREGLKNFRKGLESAGRDTEMVETLMKTREGISNPAYLLGLETKNTFNGTWGTDASWHKLFFKDIKAHEMFKGNFEAEKQIKFHEYPIEEKKVLACDGIDC
jgi:uncharacterized repeat protein (TIGR01451 family)